MEKICVFCGSSAGKNPVYKNAAISLGIALVKKEIGLVYGGGNVGLMGIMADAVLEKDGICIGVIPQSIADLEIAHQGLTELHVVDSMGERKTLMAELSDGFIAMPGGFGTLDELAEVLTYNQLRIFDKPVGLLNTNGYFNGLLQFFDHCVDERFVREEHRQNIMVSSDPVELIGMMQAYEPIHIGKWIDDIKEERKLNSVNNKKA
ncbi:MAG TPA: TIGR00730 family Rossman fold protein [Bacteroidales bacterium]|nr:TIGR00730 family Rossman fold protein [Bacteroidales bacterium]HPE55693.1 TIGR00730 family Rossman fold protein [Bacteroidales bacterium]